MKKIEILNPNTGELTEVKPNDLNKLCDIYETAVEKKNAALDIMNEIKMILVNRTRESKTDPTRLTKRIEGNAVTAILKENPKVNWDSEKLKKAKRVLGGKSFERFFKIKTEFKPQYRELNKLPHTVASSKAEESAYKLMLDARIPTGDSYFNLSWEKKKDGGK